MIKIISKILLRKHEPDRGEVFSTAKVMKKSTMSIPKKYCFSPWKEIF